MIIKAQNISKYYYSETGVAKALEKVSFEMDAGEFIAITGESGSGKSTLLNVISGFVPFEDGELYLYDEMSSMYTHRQWENFRRNKIGFVFQDYNLIERYTVLDNVISAMILKGDTKKEAIDKAKEILELVGLSKFAKQRAVKLSSGQKQRLSIARALAKDTDIIVADEPTGNLDSETGRQIMELFAGLAKNRLIIMVTHNYEQAKDYVTRRIRLYDGQIVEDEVIRPTAESADIIHKPSKKIKYNHVAAYFAALNFKRQPLRELFFAIFILITSIFAFIFLGEIYSNYDDTKTRIYDNSVFLNESDTRLIVKRNDGQTIDAADIARLRGLKHVDNVDEYDAVNDINYAYIQGEDYNSSIIYEVGDDGEMAETSEYVYEITDYSKYMHSESCISEKNLYDGHLPQDRNEIVVSRYSGYNVGDTIKVLFTAVKAWDETVVDYNMTVSGLLDEDTTQIYFDGDLCNLFANTIEFGKISYLDSYCEVEKAYMLSDEFFVLIDDVAYGVIELSSDYYMLAQHGEGLAHMLCDIAGDGQSWISYENDGKEITRQVHEEYGKHSAANFIWVSEKMYNEIFTLQGSRQAQVNIRDYAYTDKVIKEIKSLGYTAVSTLRASSIEYDEERVYNRNMLLMISFIILILLAIFDVIIVSTILRIKKKDYEVLRSMGAEPKINRKATFIELSVVTMASIIITVLAMNVLKNYIRPIGRIMLYMEWWKYIIYVAYTGLLLVLSTLLFNHSIEKKIKLK